MKPASLLPFEIVELGHRLYVHGRYSLDPSRCAGSPIDGLALQQRKTGAGRGQSPRWTGYDTKERQDFEYFVHAANAYPKLVEALRDSSMWLRIAQPSLPNTAVSDQNKATGEYLKTRGLADVVKAVEASNATLLRELGESA